MNGRGGKEGGAKHFHNKLDFRVKIPLFNYFKILH